MRTGIFIIGILLFFQCSGKKTAEEANIAFDNENYRQAILLYEEVLQEDSTNAQIKEKLALSHMHNGRQMYSKNKNIKTFMGNLEKAQAYIPTNPSQLFNIRHSEILLSLSKAYIVAKPENDIEEENFFLESISNLEQALILDSTNVKADSLLTEMNKKHFEKLLKKANRFYTNAKKTGDVNFYFNAKKYILIAKKFNPKHPEVLLLQAKLRRKLAGILDFNDGLSFAVLKHLQEKEFFTAYLAINNYLNESVKIRLKNFEITDTKGNTYLLSEEEMRFRQIYNTKSLANTTLAPKNVKDSYIEGLIVFSAPESVDMHYISYLKADSTRLKKYFR